MRALSHASLCPGQSHSKQNNGTHGEAGADKVQMEELFHPTCLDALGVPSIVGRESSNAGSAMNAKIV